MEAAAWCKAFKFRDNTFLSISDMSLRVSSLLLIGIASSLAAQSSVPPVRPLGPVMQVSPPDLFGSVSAVRPLPDGGAIVNDLVRRQLIVLNATFNKKDVIADTTPATANSYSSRVAGLIAYRGDSSLFVDPQSLSMLVIDGKGDVVRVMAVPRPNDANFMIGGPFGTPGVDPQGRIVYRGFTFPNMRGAGPPQPGQPFTPPTFPDSAPIYRVQLQTRALDTAGYFKIPATKISVTQDDRGGMRINAQANPLPVVDDWALLPDGRIAVVRGKDYHVEWLALDGTWTSTPKIPYNWERLDDDAKDKFLDSVKVEAEKQRETMNRALQSGNAAALMGGGGLASGQPMRIEMRMEAGGGGGGGGRGRQQGGNPQLSAPTVNLVSAKELPDYRPVFRQGAVRADMNGNLWVRTTAPTDAGPIYDVINAKGELIDRVKVPFGRVIAGFGPEVVYMGVQDEKGARVERAKIK